MVPRSLPSLLLPAVVATAAGCGWNDHVDSREATAGLYASRQLVQEHEWVLERSSSSLTVDDDNPVTLSVVDDDISGMAPCKAYRGEISLGDDDSVEITDIAPAQRPCDRSTMEAEDELFAALEAVDTIEVDEEDNDLLALHGDDVRLAFRPYDADALLTAGTWNIVEVTTGDGLHSVLDGTEPTLTFADDGDVTLETGCNLAASTWELDGHALSIEAMQLTLRSCRRPAGVMEQEGGLVAALQGADRAEIAPGQLTILDADGAITLTAVNG